jgi:signal transduction histidine kinase
VRVLGRRSYAPEEWAALLLDYPQNSLLVQAAAIGSRTYPEHFQYVFTLTERSGRVRQSALSRDGQLAAEGLAPGRYRIEARALGIDLVASTPVTLEVTVGRAPIPWASIALGVLLAAALAALVWGHRQNRRLALANRALAETRQQLVQETEAERRRIARDLHDQTLADLRRLLLAQTTGGREFTESVEAISTEVRRICEDLSPSVLENVGLIAALEWALSEAVRHVPEGHACRGELVCVDDLGERLSLDATVEIQIYRIVQEALSNAARHARASVIRVVVRLEEDGALSVEVEDDGCGFEPLAARGGRGLANIRSRASLIGADVAWRARPGGGCVFVLTRRVSSASGPAAAAV